MKHYVSISGGSADAGDKVDWWPWNTLRDVLTRPMIHMRILDDKYGTLDAAKDAAELKADVEHVESSIVDIFGDHTTADSIEAGAVILNMEQYTSAMDWFVYLQDKLLNVLQTEIQKKVPNSEPNIYDALNAIDLDFTGVKLRDELFDDIYSLVLFDMESIFADVTKQISVVDIPRLTRSPPDVSTSPAAAVLWISSLLSMSKHHALVMDELYKRKVFDKVFTDAAKMASHLANKD